MKPIKSFAELVAHLGKREARKRVAVVWAADDHTPQACAMALAHNIADFTFVGCKQHLQGQFKLDGEDAHVRYVDAESPVEAAARAVQLVRDGEADVLMKGLINTDDLLHAVLNKQTGILPRGNVLTHVAITQVPQLKRLLLFGDAAVIPYPTLEQRVAQVKYMTRMCSLLGIEEPRISLVHCTEKTNAKTFPFTADYTQLKQMAGNGDFGKVIIDGPLDLKTSLDRESLQEKGIDSPIDGEADVLLFPDIEAGNVFYKTITLFASAVTAGLLQGAQAPVVLSSRADSPECKFYSLAVASI